MDKSIKNADTNRSALHIAALIFAIVFPTLVTLVYFVWLRQAESTNQQVAYAIGKTVQFAFPVVWVWWFFRYRFHRSDPGEANHVGSGQRPGVPNWLWAIGFGVDVCIIMAVAAWALSGTETMSGLTSGLETKISRLGIDSLWKYVLLGTFYALVHSFLEEYYWRWFVYELLKQFASNPVANAISSLGFMAHHVVLLSVYFGLDSPMTWICSAGVAIGGAYWAWLYQRTGKLTWPWVSHMVVDAGIFALGYFLISSTFAA